MDPTKEAPKEPAAEAAETNEETSQDESKVDYKGELERLTKQHEKTVKALTKERTLRKEAKAESASSSEAETSKEKEDDADDLDVVASKVAEKLSRQNLEEEADELISQLSDDEDEKKLIKAIYENRITPSGTSRKALARDILDAQLLANRSKYQAEAEKKAKKSVAQTAAMKMAGVKVTAKSSDEEKPEYSRSEREFLKKYGVDV